MARLVTNYATEDPDELFAVRPGDNLGAAPMAPRVAPAMPPPLPPPTALPPPAFPEQQRDSESASAAYMDAPEGDAAVKRDPSALTKGEKIAMWIDAIGSGMQQSLAMKRGANAPQGSGFNPGFWQAMRDRRAAGAKEQDAKALAAAEADPVSDRSARARSAMAPMLKSLGLTPEEISSLSAADISAMTKGGNLAMSIAKAREAAKTAAAERAQKQADLQEGRTYKEEQAAGPEFERRKEIARIQSRMTGDRSADIAILNDELARARAAEEDARRAGREGEKRTLEGAKDYGLALQKTGIPTAEATLDRVEQLAAKLKKKHGGKLFSDGDDVVRRAADAANKPEMYNMMDDPEAAELMREVQTLRNIQIKDQAGGNVTTSEFGRQQVAMGNTALADAGAIVRWTKSMRRGLDADRENLLGAFGPEAAEQYERNRAGARKGGGAGKGGGAAAGMVRVRNPKTGEEKTFKDSAELQKRIKSGALEVVSGG